MAIAPPFNWNEWNQSMWYGRPKTQFAWGTHPDWNDANFVTFTGAGSPFAPVGAQGGTPTGIVSGNWSTNYGNTTRAHSFDGYRNGVYYDRQDGSLASFQAADVQTVGVGAATAGTFTLSLFDPTLPALDLDVTLTTAAIAFNATAAAVQAALAALVLSDGSNPAVTVTGTAPTWTVTFTGTPNYLAGNVKNGQIGFLPLATMTINGSALTGGTPAVTHTTVGNDGTWMMHLQAALTTALGANF